MSDEPNQPPPSNALQCPTCGGPVDPRRTTQALSRNARLLLFCSSGCLRQFLAVERAEKEAKKAAKPPEPSPSEPETK